ncbi:MAG: porin, partial [Pseudomonadota bacterium]
MQKKLIVAAVAGALAAPLAIAQSNVTIYGIADVGVEWGSSGNGTKFRVQSGQESGSRLGFKGSEDLGGGLKANF